MEKNKLNKWLKTSLIAIAILVASLALGFGVIKLYQQFESSQLGKDKQALVDPVADIRQTCSNLRKSSASQLYGDTSRRLPGDERQITTFTGLARVIQTDPVVLDFDTASIRPLDDNPVFDEAVRKLPTRQFVVTDSAVFGLNMGDVIRASVDYSQPSTTKDLDELAEEDREVAVKLQNALVVEDRQKHGLFATNFTIYASPPKPTGIIYMASGDVYSYNQTEDGQGSGVENVSHYKNTGTAWVAQQLARLKLYAKKGAITTEAPSVFCGYAYTSKDDINEADNQIILNTLGY